MIDKTKDYWLALKPYIYVSNDTFKILLYNTLNADYLEISDEEIKALIDSIHEKKNLGVSFLSSKELENAHCYKFIEQLCEKGMGDVSDVGDYERKPIRLMPILNLQRDVEKLRKENDRLIGEGVMHYLTNLILYVNSGCDIKCKNCSSYFKQVNCCTVNGQPKELSLDVIKQIVLQIEHSPISSIEIMGGNILEYSYLTKLRNIFSGEIKLNYWIHDENIAKCNDEELIDSLQTKTIIVNFPINQELLECCLNKTDNNSTFNFIVENLSQFEKAEEIIQNYNLHSHQIIPFYNGNNIDFFRENIFLTKEDILSEPIEQRKIFCNQKLNSNYFGSLHIYSDGSVRASANTELIGNINNDQIIDIIAKEMDINTAWRKVRNEEPCNSCLYQYLCPPPSNYEHAIGKYNLCHIINA
ncbi:MAG: TIGR04150 pseudo-rSAM protein [Prevotellaceae bacterium]|jgi:pseudo-rSAM protein|nr:TIGR04150 pseudo-rSAM protein [Prevotellaceae bacterium]